MFERLIRFAIEQRWMVLFVTLAMAAVGIYNYSRLSIDAVPDITNVQVQINTAAPGYSPLETEQRVTYPIETVMAGLPGLEQNPLAVALRAVAGHGDLQRQHQHLFRAPAGQRTTAASARKSSRRHIGHAGADLDRPGRDLLLDGRGRGRRAQADGSPYTSTDLREIQDWVVKPQLRNIPGVTEINSIGGYAKEYLVAPNTEQLASYGLSLTDIMTALDRNNANIGAGYIERKGEQYLIRAPGQVQSVDDIGNVLLTAVNGQAIRVRDVAEVSIGRELRTGAATDNGKEVVLGTAFMLIGENSRTVSLAVSDRIAAINKTLPEGVKLITAYDRSNLVDKAIATVKKNLLEGATLVIVILFLFLGNIRAALITAMVIPLSMLFTFTGMVTYKVSANLMSLGALDFGIIIDGAVVIVENCVRRLSHSQAHHGRPLTRSERFHEVFAAAREARRPLLFGQLIIMVVYLPIFALTGVEGRMFHPMALTVVLALLGAMILSVTFVPAAVALFMGNKVAEKENRLMSWAKRRYEPLLDMALRRTPRVLIAATVFMVACGVLASRMGSEFIPSLNEGDMAIQALRIPGTSLSQSLEMQKQLEVRLKEKFPRSNGSSRAPARPRSPRTRCRRTSPTATSCSSPWINGRSRARPMPSCWPPSRRKRARCRATTMSSPSPSSCASTS